MGTALTVWESGAVERLCVWYWGDFGEHWCQVGLPDQQHRCLEPARIPGGPPDTLKERLRAGAQQGDLTSRPGGFQHRPDRDPEPGTRSVQVLEGTRRARRCVWGMGGVPLRAGRRGGSVGVRLLRQDEDKPPSSLASPDMTWGLSSPHRTSQHT